MGGFEGPRTVTSGLVGYWDAGNAKSYPGSGTTWTDLSGNGNNGTLTNSPTYSSGAITFAAASSQYASGSLSTISTWSMCLWYKSTDITSAVVFYPFSCTDVTGIGFGGTFSANTIGKWWFFDGVAADAFPANSITTNTWYNMVVTKTSTSYTFYTNGIQTATATGTNLSLNKFRIGGRADGFWYVSGSAAIASVYNRELSPQEVSQNFNALRGRFGV